MIPDQEEKFEIVFNNLDDKPSEQLMFNRFLETYPDDWKQLKVTFSKFKRRLRFNSWKKEKIT